MKCHLFFLYLLNLCLFDYFRTTLVLKTMFLRRLVITLVFGLFALAFSASAAEAKTDFPFIVVTRDTVKTEPVFTDEQFYALSASVVFKVNEATISPDDQFYSLFQDQILPMVNARHLQLRKIYVRGAASPEGPYERNVLLSRARTQALLDAVSSSLRFQYLETELDANSITEDYRYLIIMMAQANDPDLATVKDIFEKCNGNERRVKSQLQRNWPLWQRIFKKYFTQLRAAHVILWFSEPDQEHAPIPTMAAAIKPALLTAPAALSPRSPYAAYNEQPAEDTVKTRRHLIAIRTNLIHDFFYMPQVGWSPSPNVQLEFYPKGGHWTANIGFTWGTRRKWDQQKFFQVRDLNLEARRYFKGKGQFTGFYLGAFLHGDIYGIGLNGQKGWQGEGAGVGISGGYVLPLTKKGDLRLEFMLGVGAFLTFFDPYVYGNPVTGDIDGYYYYNYLGSATDFKRRNHMLTWFGPTNLGIQLTYDIIYRKRQK